jgi:hypothetical protein
LEVFVEFVLLAEFPEQALLNVLVALLPVHVELVVEDVELPFREPENVVAVRVPLEGTNVSFVDDVNSARLPPEGELVHKGYIVEDEVMLSEINTVFAVVAVVLNVEVAELPLHAAEVDAEEAFPEQLAATVALDAVPVRAPTKKFVVNVPVDGMKDSFVEELFGA